MQSSLSPRAGSPEVEMSIDMDGTVTAITSLIFTLGILSRFFFLVLLYSVPIYFSVVLGAIITTWRSCKGLHSTPKEPILPLHRRDSGELSAVNPQASTEGV